VATEHTDDKLKNARRMLSGVVRGFEQYTEACIKVGIGRTRPGLRRQPPEPDRSEIHDVPSLLRLGSMTDNDMAGAAGLAQVPATQAAGPWTRSRQDRRAECRAFHSRAIFAPLSWPRSFSMPYLARFLGPADSELLTLFWVHTYGVQAHIGFGHECGIDTRPFPKPMPLVSPANPRIFWTANNVQLIMGA